MEVQKYHGPTDLLIGYVLEMLAHLKTVLFMGVLDSCPICLEKLTYHQDYGQLTGREVITSNVATSGSDLAPRWDIAWSAAGAHFARYLEDRC